MGMEVNRDRIQNTSLTDNKRERNLKIHTLLSGEVFFLYIELEFDVIKE